MSFQRNPGFLLSKAIFFCTLLICSSVYAEILDKVIAVVNDEVVTQREFDRTYSEIKKNYESNFEGEELRKRLEAAKGEFLEQMINTKLTLSLAKQAEIKINETELDGRIEKIRSFYSSEEEFLKALYIRGTTLSEFEREIREQMLAQKLVEKEVSSKIIISPSEVKDLYDKNKDKLVSSRQVKVRTIMVRKTEDLSPRKVRKKMKVIISKLEMGRQFDALAAEVSEGPYAEKGGDMGYVSPGETIKEIDEAVFALKAGERSGIIETNIGYHIFLVEDTKEPYPLQLGEVSDYLREQLYMKKFEEEIAKWFEGKRKNAYISYK